ncbi:MAG: hypothetical protein U0744_11860 [Gemmataceae bacterium]
MQLHDIGKIGVPDDILYKASSLTREELDNVRDQLIAGERLRPDHPPRRRARGGSPSS